MPADIGVSPAGLVTEMNRGNRLVNRELVLIISCWSVSSDNRERACRLLLEQDPFSDELNVIIHYSCDDGTVATAKEKLRHIPQGE